MTGLMTHMWPVQVYLKSLSVVYNYSYGPVRVCRDLLIGKYYSPSLKGLETRHNAGSLFSLKQNSLTDITFQAASTVKSMTTSFTHSPSHFPYGKCERKSHTLTYTMDNRVGCSGGSRFANNLRQKLSSILIAIRLYTDAGPFGVFQRELSERLLHRCSWCQSSNS